MSHIHNAFNSGAFFTLLALMGVDIISGLIVAIYQKSGHTLHGGIESAHFIKGIWRKTLNICVFFLAAVLSYYIGYNIAIVVEGVLIGYEGISIIENFSLLGFPMPTALKKLFESFYNRDKGDGEK